MAKIYAKHQFHEKVLAMKKGAGFHGQNFGDFDDFLMIPSAKRLSVGSLETILITKELRSAGIWWISGYKWI